MDLQELADVNVACRLNWQVVAARMRPSSQARAARLRVLKNRATHSHLSTTRAAFAQKNKGPIRYVAPGQNRKTSEFREILSCLDTLKFFRNMLRQTVDKLIEVSNGLESLVSRS